MFSLHYYNNRIIMWVKYLYFSNSKGNMKFPSRQVLLKAKGILVVILILQILILLMTNVSAATIYVDDDRLQYPNADYQDIREAILWANDGDTIIVYPGTYDPFTVDKRLTLTGINHPLIESSPDGTGINLNADYCTIEGFTVKGGNHGIHVNSNESIIRNNVLLNNHNGIYLLNTNANIISQNTIQSNDFGIYVDESYDTLITSNRIIRNGVGVYIEDSDVNYVDGNSVSYNNNDGIALVYSLGNEIKNNKVLFNNIGVSLIGSSQNKIYKNTFFNNSYLGIELITFEQRDPGGNVISYIPCSDNFIYLNNFVENNIQAHLYLKDEDVNTWNSPERLSYTYDGDSYTGYMGNNWSDFYWRDRYDSGPRDGIWDFPYLISNDYGNDRYDEKPLVHEWELYFGLIYNLPPQASFTYSPSTPGNNTPVTFNASETLDPDGDVIAFDWDFGDGSTASGEIVTHTFGYPGKYTVKLTVTDNDGETNSIAELIDVQPPDTTPPSLSLWPSNGSYSSKDWVIVTVTANEELDNATLYWDGSKRETKDVNGTFVQFNVTNQGEGMHTFYVEAYDLSGNKGQSVTNTIIVDLTPPTVSFISAPTNGAEVNQSWVYIEVSAEDNYELSGVSLDWNGTLYPMFENRYYNLTGLSSGTYSYKVLATDMAGNVGETEERMVTINITTIGEPPVADFTYSPSNPEVWQTINFTDMSYDPDGTIVSWYWDLGDGMSSSIDQNPRHTYSSPGTYTVRLTVTDNDGDTDSISKTITVSAPSNEGGTGGTGSSSGGGGGGGGGGGLPLPPPTTNVTKPTPTPTKLRTPASIPWIPPKKTSTPSSAPLLPGTPSEKETPKPTPKTPEPFTGPKGLLPGFEAVFAILGLAAVAYLVGRGKIS